MILGCEMKYKTLALVFIGMLAFSYGVDKFFAFLEAEHYKRHPIAEIEVVIRQLAPLKSRLISKYCTHPPIGKLQVLMDCMERIERKMYRTDI